MYKKGIDVSRWQGTIDWEKVKADGVEFAMLRAGWYSLTRACRTARGQRTRTANRTQRAMSAARLRRSRA